MKDKIISLLLMLFVAVGAYAQGTQVSGTVVDEQGLPFPGASVIVAGTTQGTVTDIDGNFSLKVDDAASKSLTISCIGFETQNVSLASKTTGINVTLVEEHIALNEVVAIGYGTTKRKDVTGSVASVSSEALMAVPVTSATEALTGKMAGVQITTTEGSPDADITIRVRGGGSITGDNAPLYIVDGFPVESIADIPASDIESIDVLKDASSTAIYGSRGANGVILVTTKTGKEGKTQVTYNAYYSWKKVAKTMDVLHAKDYVKWNYELEMLQDGKTDEINPSDFTELFGNWEDIDQYDDVPENDWQDLTFGRIGHTFNHNISVIGGSDQFKYSFGYGMIDDKAIMEMSSFKRDNASLKLSTKPHKKVTLDFSMRYAKTKVLGGGANESATENSSSDARLKHAVLFSPIPVEGLTTVSGDDTDPSTTLYNPIENLADNDRKKIRKNMNLAAAFSWEIIKGLKIKLEYGYDDYRQDDYRFYGMTTYYIKNIPSSENQGQPAVTFTKTQREKQRNTNTISYDFKKLLPEDHNLNILIREEYIIKKEDELVSVTHGLPTFYTSKQAFALAGQGVAYSINNEYDPDDKMLSFFGRLNYDYQSKYLLSATFRADGSSKFSDGNKWGYFPSVAVAWRISSESFMDATKSWMDDLKLRVSFGTAGNNNIPSGQTVQTYSSSTSSWVNGYSSFLNPSKVMANPDLTWETTVTRNIGLDFTLLNSKLNGSFELYLNTTKDLLINFPVSGSGYDTQYRNMGKTENKGFEVSLTYNILDRPKYGVSFTANVGINRNKIKSLGDMEDFGADTSWASTEIANEYWIAKGGSVGKLYGYRYDGRYETSDFAGYEGGTWVLNDGVATNSITSNNTPGSIKLKDLNGDGEITVDDKEIIGDVNPDVSGGFAINARAYGFDFAANFTYSIGNDVYNANKIEYTSTSKYSNRNMIDKMAEGKRWTNLKSDGTLSTDLNELAEMNKNTTMHSPYMSKFIFSDWAVEDGSFLRLSTLTLGYTIPKDITRKYHIENLRVYCSAYNVFCITGYSGFDPEVSSRVKTALTPNCDYSAYPKSRQLVVGLNLNF